MDARDVSSRRSDPPLKNDEARRQRLTECGVGAENGAKLGPSGARAVRERPILFSGPMVRAILAGTKTQTRRVVKPQPFFTSCQQAATDAVAEIAEAAMRRVLIEDRCPYGVPGERLWVRETWRSRTRDLVAYKADGQAGAWMGDGGGGRIWIRHGWLVGYTAPGQTGQWMGEKKYGDRWRPSIHMPRDYSRLTLEVTEARVQRLQEIDHADIRAEGVLDKAITGGELVTLRRLFGEAWDSINGKRAPWAGNPWVWAISFKRLA
jgi:hypothetical protein